MIEGCSASAPAEGRVATAGGEANQQGRAVAASVVEEQPPVARGVVGTSARQGSGPTRGDGLAQRAACRRARACCDAFASVVATAPEEARSLIDTVCVHLDRLGEGTGDRDADAAMGAACEAAIQGWRESLSSMGHAIPQACRP